MSTEQKQKVHSRSVKKVTVINKKIENELFPKQYKKVELINDNVLKQDVRRLENWKYYQNGKKEEFDSFINLSDDSSYDGQTNRNQIQRDQTNSPKIRYKMLDMINRPIHR